MDEYLVLHEVLYTGRVTRYRCERDSMQSGAGVKAGGVVAAPVVMV